MCHGSLFSFSCEAGSSLSVLSELGHLCLVFFLQTTHSGNLFAAFVTLLRKPNETHHKLEKISRSACQKWILSGLRCMSLSGSSEKYGQFLHDQPIMQNQTDAKSLKAFKLLGNPNAFCKLFFLSFLEINPNMQELDRSRAHALERSNSCMFGSFTAGSFQRPLHTCAILYGHSTMNDQSAKHCD